VATLGVNANILEQESAKMSPAIIRNLGVAAAVWVTLAPTSRAADAPPACTEDSHYSQQDFALGKWDVYSGAQRVAKVHLQKILKGCLIRFTWTAVSESEGNEVGLLAYVRPRGHWGFFAVADTGAISEFSGDPRGTNEMLYVPPPQRDKPQRHLTLKLQPDGSIQQLAAGSTDGQTWSTEYELIWRRSK
jgi:hypothetical protein